MRHATLAKNENFWQTDESLENSLLNDTLDTLNAVIADPQCFDFTFNKC